MVKGFEQTLHQKRYMNVNKHVKRWPTSLVISEIQIKTEQFFITACPLEWQILKRLTIPDIGEDMKHWNSYRLLMAM